jgi:hypothetical protein
VFKWDIKPIINWYLDLKVSPEDEDDSEPDLSNLEPLEVDLSGLNPQNATMTVEVIIESMSLLRPHVKVPATMAKRIAIDYFNNYVRLRDAKD